MKRFLSVIAIMAMTFSLAACGNSSSSTSSGNSQSASTSATGGGINEHTFNFFCIQAESTTYYQSAVKFADMVKEASDGKINIDVYANGSLSGGDQAAALEMIQKGSIDMGMITAAVCGNMINDLRVTLIPFIFKNGEEDVDKALLKGSDLYDLYESEFNDYDMHMMGIAEHGFRQLTNNKKEVTKPEDLKGMKIRVLATPVLVDFFNAMGVNVTDISNTEIYTSLQNGTIDAQENPLVQSYLAGFTSVAPNVTIWDYCYDAHPFLMSNNLWESLTPDEQELFTSVTDEWIPVQREMMRDAYDDVYNDAEADGAKIVELDQQQKEAFTAIADETSKPYIQELQSTYDMLINDIK